MLPRPARRAEEVQHQRRLEAVRPVHCLRRRGALSGARGEAADPVQAAGQGGQEAHVHVAQDHTHRRRPSGQCWHVRLRGPASGKHQQRAWSGLPEWRTLGAWRCFMSDQRFGSLGQSHLSALVGLGHLLHPPGAQGVSIVPWAVPSLGCSQASSPSARPRTWLRTHGLRSPSLSRRWSCEYEASPSLHVHHHLINQTPTCTHYLEGTSIVLLISVP